MELRQARWKRRCGWQRRHDQRSGRAADRRYINRHGEWRDYQDRRGPQAGGAIREALRSPDKMDEVALARRLDEHFRAQYRRAAALAAGGR